MDSGLLIAFDDDSEFVVPTQGVIGKGEHARSIEQHEAVILQQAVPAPGSGHLEAAVAVLQMFDAGIVGQRDNVLQQRLDRGERRLVCAINDLSAASVEKPLRAIRILEQEQDRDRRLGKSRQRLQLRVGIRVILGQIAAEGIEDVVFAMRRRDADLTGVEL